MARGRRGAANGRGLPRRSAARARPEAAAPAPSLLEPSGRPGQARSVDPPTLKLTFAAPVDLERYRKYAGWSSGRQGLVLERYRPANRPTMDPRERPLGSAKPVSCLAWFPVPARATDEAPGGRAAARTRHRSAIRGRASGAATYSQRAEGSQTGTGTQVLPGSGTAGCRAGHRGHRPPVCRIAVQRASVDDA